MFIQGSAKEIRKRHRRQELNLMRRHWQMYLFLIVPIIWLIIFQYIPLAGIQIAFRNYKISRGIWGSPWVGFSQFERFFSSIQFRSLLVNTIRLSLYNLAAGFPLPIVLALCLNAVLHGRYKKFVQTVTYIPHFISTVVLVGMLLQFFNVRVGLYGSLGRALLGRTPKDMLGSPVAFVNLYVWSGVWQNMGWGSIVYIAALSSIGPELHEAAQIDGASRFARCLHIDFPAILPTAIILLIMNAGKVMSVGFQKVFLMQNPLNLATSEVISTYVYKVGLSAEGTLNFSYATAIDLFNSVVNLTLLFIVNAISRHVSDTSLW